MYEVTLKTVTQSDTPNRNHVVYTKEAFEKMANDMNKKIKEGIRLPLTCESYDMMKPDDFYSVNVNNILGDIKEIRDGSIDVSIYHPKKEIFDELIKNGYEPGMRYMTNSESCTMDDSGNRVVNDITKIISYDFIKLPNI